LGPDLLAVRPNRARYRSQEGTDVPSPDSKHLDGALGEVDHARGIDTGGSGVDDQVNIVAYSLLDIARIGERQVVTRQKQRRTHDRLSEGFQNGSHERMVGYPQTDRTPFRVLESLWNLPRGREDKGIGTWRHCLQHTIRPVVDPGVGADFREIAANQREVVVLIGTPNAPDSIHGPFIANMATECIARVRRVCDQSALADGLDDLRYKPRLRIDWMNFNDFCHARILGKSSAFGYPCNRGPAHQDRVIMRALTAM
jgi:hypothetical protein